MQCLIIRSYVGQRPEDMVSATAVERLKQFFDEKVISQGSQIK